MTQPGNNGCAFSCMFNGQWSQWATLKTRFKTCLRLSSKGDPNIVIYNSASAPKCPIKALFVAKNGVGDRNITMVRYVAHFSEHASPCEVKY